jgi:alpha-beta hydrolase superfamily lysophospholipase
MSTIRLGFYSLLALLFTLVLAGSATAQPAPDPLDGLWKGPLKLPGGQLDVTFRLVKLSSGEYFATLDVPLQRVNNLAVSVSTHADTVLFVSAEANCRFTGHRLPDGKQLQGIWQQPGFQVPLTLTRTVPQLAAKPRLTPPYREESVTFSNAKAGVQLAGTLTVPAGPGPFPAVALLSDVGAQDRNGTVNDFAPIGRLADFLTRRGIAVLRFDDRGTGQSGGSDQATLADQLGDAQAALAFLRTRSEIVAKQVGLVGHGEGGNVALLAAAQPEPPAFVVGLAPYGLPGGDIALQQQEATLRSLQLAPAELDIVMKRQKAIIDAIRQTINRSQAQAIVANILKQNNPVLDNAAVQARAAEMTSSPYRYFLGFDPAETLAGVTCPVLLLYGSADTVINPDNNLNALVKGLKANKVVTARKLPGVNHLFQPAPDQWPIVGGQSQPNFSPAAAEAVRAWLATQAPPAAAPAAGAPTSAR